MRVAHFIFMRFCVRGGRWLNHVDGPWFSAVNPLRPRNVDFRSGRWRRCWPTSGKKAFVAKEDG